MGRPKDFPNIHDDLLTKHKSKSIADKDYKEYMPMARVRAIRTGRETRGSPPSLLLCSFAVCSLELFLTHYMHLNRSRDCQRRHG